MRILFYPIIYLDAVKLIQDAEDLHECALLSGQCAHSVEDKVIEVIVAKDAFCNNLESCSFCLEMKGM